MTQQPQQHTPSPRPFTPRPSLGVAVIGTGTMGADHVRRIDEVISGAHVAAVVDLDETRARQLAETTDGCTAYAGLTDALAAPDVGAVLLASPGPAHEAQLLAALAHDLPVLCEKPLTPDAESALRVLDAERALGRRRIQVGFMRRYDSEYRKLKRLLSDGTLGRTLLMHCRHRNVRVHDYFTNSMLISDSVVHEMDCARWLLEQEIAAVTVVRPRPSALAPAGLEDPQVVLFETTEGAVVTVEMFATSGFGYQVQAEAVCERGTARIGEGHDLLVNSRTGWGGEIPQDYIARFADAYDLEVQEWVNAAREGRATGPSAWDGYAAAAVCAAGIRAQETGQRTVVELAERPDFYA